MDNPEKLATFDILTPIIAWTIQRNWQHWVKHTRYLNTNYNMDNLEKLATLGKTYTIS